MNRRRLLAGASESMAITGMPAAMVASMSSFSSLGSADRKSTRLNSSHTVISYAVFCLKKKSDMRDERICAIRPAMEKRGDIHTRIMAYSPKYTSAFYSPFRDAGGAAGTRDKSHPKLYP